MAAGGCDCVGGCDCACAVLSLCSLACFVSVEELFVLHCNDANDTGITGTEGPILCASGDKVLSTISSVRISGEKSLCAQCSRTLIRPSSASEMSDKSLESLTRSSSSLTDTRVDSEFSLSEKQNGRIKYTVI